MSCRYLPPRRALYTGVLSRNFLRLNYQERGRRGTRGACIIFRKLRKRYNRRNSYLTPAISLNSNKNKFAQTIVLYEARDRERSREAIIRVFLQTPQTDKKHSNSSLRIRTPSLWKIADLRDCQPARGCDIKHWENKFLSFWPRRRTQGSV